MNNDRIVMQTLKKTKDVTYIMMSSFRILDNHCLFYALNNYDNVEIILVRIPEENERNNQYFRAHSTDLMQTLNKIGSTKIIYDKDEISKHIHQDVIVDKGYLKAEKKIENIVLNATDNKFGITIIESNVLVPVTITSNKEEYSARTIRPKIHKKMYNFMDPVLEELEASSVELQAIEECEKFIEKKLSKYDLKNHPEFDYSSNLSVYLKYGIISPVRILVLLEKSKHANKDEFIEELIVRRELAYNFVYYNNGYFKFENMTYNWAYETMKFHRLDHKEYIYTIDDYINYRTHDKYFNAAMKEMVYLGKMHGYMRMYWAKKIIEWSGSFEQAYQTTIYLNNYYFLDGNTPNGYTGVAWCFGKHDRAWKERMIFGKIRYMNENGLKRKFDIDLYVERVTNEIDSKSAKKI